MEASQPSTHGGKQYQPTNYQQIPMFLRPLLNVEHNAPCYLSKLPIELRQEIFKYLVPELPDHQPPFAVSGRVPNATPLINLLLGFNRQIYGEVQNLLYARAAPIIHIDQYGVTFGHRRILGPTGPMGPDGGIYLDQNDVHRDIGQFNDRFPWAKFRNYQIDLTFAVHDGVHSSTPSPHDRDEYIEKFLMRVVCGVLSKACILERLHVQLNFVVHGLKFENAVSTSQLFLGPFKRLRCVKKPRLLGIYQIQRANNMDRDHRDPHSHHSSTYTADPVFRTVPIWMPVDMAAIWENTLALQAPTSIMPSPPTTKLFNDFKDAHDMIITAAPHLRRYRRQCFLHRARMARERGDKERFHGLVAQLAACWRHHLQVLEAQRRDVSIVLDRITLPDM